MDDRDGPRGPRTPGGTVGRRSLLRATGGGALGLTLAGCLDAAPLQLTDDAAGPIRIGVLAPRPDRNLIGQSTVHGAELAAAEVTAGDDLAGIPDVDSFAAETTVDVGPVLEAERAGDGEPPAGFDEDVSLDVGELLEPGILGRDVEVLVRDTKGSPAEARRRYQELVVEEDVDLTMGIFWTEVLAHVIDDIAAQETLHITVGSASSAPNALIGEDYDRYKYHFRLGPFKEDLLFRNQMDFIRGMEAELDWEQVAILTEGYDWAEQLGLAFEASLPAAGYEVVQYEHYPPEVDDFESRYQQAIDGGADVLLVGMSHTGDEAILQWAEMDRPFDFSGIHIPAQRPDYHGLPGIGDAPEYSIGQTIATDTMGQDIPAIERLIDRYTARFDGEIPMFTGYGSYMAVIVYAAAASAAGTVDPEVLVPTLESLHFDGPTGPIEFYGRDSSHAHDPVYGEDHIQGVFFQWQDGRQEVIWPERFATAEYVSPT